MRIYHITLRSAWYSSQVRTYLHGLVGNKVLYSMHESSLTSFWAMGGNGLEELSVGVDRVCGDCYVVTDVTCDRCHGAMPEDYWEWLESMEALCGTCMGPLEEYGRGMVRDDFRSVREIDAWIGGGRYSCIRGLLVERLRERLREVYGRLVAGG